MAVGLRDAHVWLNVLFVMAEVSGQSGGAELGLLSLLLSVLYRLKLGNKTRKLMVDDSSDLGFERSLGSREFLERHTIFPSESSFHSERALSIKHTKNNKITFLPFLSVALLNSLPYFSTKSNSLSSTAISLL